MPEDRLADYRAKRDTTASGEPSGRGERSTKGGHPLFVVQRHDASSLHFDVRLEIDGALASWAVPKGPSPDPRDKRLAVHVEDHPLDYADFEGRIGEGYGEGTVIVWDTGTWDNISIDEQGHERTPAEAVAAGHLTFVLHGEKLTGEFALLHSRLGGDERNWLLVKADDEGADRRRKPTSTQNESVLSGKTNADFESAPERPAAED